MTKIVTQIGWRGNARTSLFCFCLSVCLCIAHFVSCCQSESPSLTAFNDPKTFIKVILGIINNKMRFQVMFLQVLLSVVQAVCVLSSSCSMTIATSSPEGLQSPVRMPLLAQVCQMLWPAFPAFPHHISTGWMTTMLHLRSPLLPKHVEDIIQ